MKKHLAIIAAIMAICAVSAASCGNDATVEDISPTEATEMTVASGEAVSSSETSSEVTKTTKKTKSSKSTKEKSTKTTAVSSKQKGVVLTANGEKATPTKSETTAVPTETAKPRGNAPLNPASPPPVTTQAPTEPEKKSVTVGFEDLLTDISRFNEYLNIQNSRTIDSEIFPDGTEVLNCKNEYEGIEVSYTSKDDVYTVYSIKITGGEHATDKGIRIGSSREEVEAAYGTGEGLGDKISYISGEKKLNITYSGDTVSEIEFYAEVQ